jgi:MFS family permease
MIMETQMPMANQATLAQAARRLPIALVGNAVLRIAGGASGVLVGLYLADLANRGERIGAALVGVLGAVSFIAELLVAVPMGMLSDAFAPRVLMTGGALLGGVATQMFGMTGWVSIFFFSRALEGFGAGAGAPALLAHITDVTEHNAPLRAKAMSYFELSLLGGLALGGFTGAQLWQSFHTAAFASVASVYLLSATLLFVGARGTQGRGPEAAMAGLWRALGQPSLRRLAPVWLCINSIVGIWLGPTFTFLLVEKEGGGHFLAGVFAERPERVGWLLLGYSIVFGAGVTVWSFVMPRVSALRVMRIGITAMFAVCIGLFALNHAAGAGTAARWGIGVLTALCTMVESGFTPAALSLLADAVGSQAGRGAAMGIYSVLLSIGAIVGSVLAAALGHWFAVDGLIYGTFAMAIMAMPLLNRLSAAEVCDARR